LECALIFIIYFCKTVLSRASASNLILNRKPERL